MQIITASPITSNRLNYSSQNKPSALKENNVNNYTMNGMQSLANQNLAFMSRRFDDNIEGIPRYNRELVADEAEGHYSFYLRNNPEEFYNKNGLDINKFLRNGYLQPITEDDEDVPSIFKDYIEKNINEKKDYNRAIIDSVGVLDSMMDAKTKDVTVVYRYAPTSWLYSQKNGVVQDKGFFATTTDKNIALKDCEKHRDNTCFEIVVPEGMPYIDLTDREKPVMLFPRGLKFNILDENSLEMLSKDDKE